MGDNNTMEPVGEAMAAAIRHVDCYDPAAGDAVDYPPYRLSTESTESDEELRKERLLETPPAMCDMDSVNVSGPSHCDGMDESTGHLLVANKEASGGGGEADAGPERSCSDEEIDVVGIDFAPVEIDTAAEQYTSPIKEEQTFFGKVLRTPNGDGEFWMRVTEEGGRATAQYTVDTIGVLCRPGISALNRVMVAAVASGYSMPVAHCAGKALLRAMFHCDTVEGRRRYSVDYVDEGRTETVEHIDCLPGTFHRPSTLLNLETSAVKCKMVPSPCKFNVSNMDSTTRDGWQVTQHGHFWDRAEQSGVVELYVKSVDGLTHYVMPVMQTANDILG